MRATMSSTHLLTIGAVTGRELTSDDELRHIVLSYDD